MSLDMFLEILGSLEGFATKFALVWLQGNVDSNVRGDMVALDGCGTAATPLTRQVQVVGALAAYMSFADMFLWTLLVRRGRAWAPWLIRVSTHVECFS